MRGRKAALLSSLGAGLEYYDFIIYGMMAEQLSTLFFSGDEPWLALMKAFGVFAIGYLIRPFGGIFFGMIGDTFGRKKAFLAVMFLMAGATFAIGLLPTYEQIGPLAPLLLLLLRTCQGLSFGAELPGAVTVVCESAEEGKHGCYSGIVISSVGIGSALATLVLFVLSVALPIEQVMDWGWRVPFLLGGLLAAASYLIRKGLQETPAYLEWRRQCPTSSLIVPFSQLFSRYSGQLVQGIGLTWLVASLVIFSLYLPTYLTQYYAYPPSDIYLAMTCGMLWSALSLPFAGRLADLMGKARVLVATCLLFVGGVWLLFQLLEIGSLLGLTAFMMLYQSIISMASVCFFPLLSALFPTQVRYTGTAFCYNSTYAIMGCLPIVTTGIVVHFSTATAAIGLLAISALITCFSAVRWFKDYSAERSG